MWSALGATRQASRDMIDANLYKQMMRRYATGVMVLTIREGENFHAVTVNSVTSVSLEPILLLVCLEKNARSHELLRRAGTFALMILSNTQSNWANASPLTALPGVHRVNSPSII